MFLSLPKCSVGFFILAIQALFLSCDQDSGTSADTADVSSSSIEHHSYSPQSSSAGIPRQNTQTCTSLASQKRLQCQEKTYATTTIGTQVWMAENLIYEPQTGSTWCYDNDPENCGKLGRLYDWATANSVCPIGWHLPSNAEWDSLAAFIRRAQNESYAHEGCYLKAAADSLDWVSGNWLNYNFNEGDPYAFSALPSGGYSAENSTMGAYFLGLSRSTSFWSATDYSPFMEGWAWYRSLQDSDEALEDGSTSQSDGLSVRCLQD